MRVFFWRRQTVYALVLFLVLLPLVWQLSVVPNGASSTEVANVRAMQNIDPIAENPLWLPYKAAGYLALQVSESVRVVRALSIVTLGLCSVALYRILKRWHSERIALFASGMFATNAFVLGIARHASPEVLLFGWSIIVATLLWMLHGHSKRVAPVSLAIFSSLLVYVPGAPYFFILLAVFFFSKLRNVTKRLATRHLVAGIILGLIVLAPLVVGFVYNPSLIKNWLLLPSSIEWSTIWRDILQVPSAFIYRTPLMPEINVGRLPVLDVSAGGLLLIGLYAYQKNLTLDRTKIMMVTAIFSVILGALGAVMAAIVILLPFVYAIIAAGISFLLDLWYSVFPRNPLARTFGIVIVTLAVIFGVYYQLTRFLVVWTQTPETRQTYNQSRLLQ